MGDFGIKSSQEGVDVKTPDTEEVTFTSEFSHPKVKIYASPSHFDYLSYTFGSTVANGTYTLFTKAHGYSYEPAHLSMVGAPAGSDHLFSFAPRYIFGGSGDIHFRCYTDASNWYTKVRVTGGLGAAIANTTWKFKYNIWAENGS